jgi:hypothetical protein
MNDMLTYLIGLAVGISTVALFWYVITREDGLKHG